MQSPLKRAFLCAFEARKKLHKGWNQAAPHNLTAHFGSTVREQLKPPEGNLSMNFLDEQNTPSKENSLENLYCFSVIVDKETHGTYSIGTQLLM